MSKIRTRKLGVKIQETIQTSKSELKQIDLVAKKLKLKVYLWLKMLILIN